jgi:sulfur-oxidizing protein SoxY
MASDATRLPRREVLVAGLGLVAWVWLRPAIARESLAAAVARFAAGTTVRAGKVAIDVAPLVENGNTVPLTVSVDSPMTADAYVQKIAIFNELNPLAEVATFHLGPRAGRASVSLRIRLADSQKIVAVAQLSDGSLWSHTADVVVTIAGCIEN